MISWGPSTPAFYGFQWKGKVDGNAWGKEITKQRDGSPIQLIPKCRLSADQEQTPQGVKRTLRLGFEYETVRFLFRGSEIDWDKPRSPDILMIHFYFLRKGWDLQDEEEHSKGTEA